jgi:hypothetical protein
MLMVFESARQFGARTSWHRQELQELSSVWRRSEALPRCWRDSR